MNAVANVASETKLNLLFVDDEKNILIPLRAMFKRDYEVFTAVGGREALELMQMQPIHIVVSDQRMPEMLGVELLEKIRQYSPATVRILLTGYSDLTAAINCINEGAVFRFIEKPWDNQSLRETLALAADVARYHLNSNPKSFATLPSMEELIIAVDGETETVAEAPTAQQVEEPLEANLPDGDVLVMEDDQSVFKDISRLFGRSRKVLFASAMDEATAALNKHDIGVLVVDTRVNNQDTIALIHILKKRYPALITVVLTGDADTNMVIRLINQGQVFRYLTKPVKLGQLKLSLQSALKYHAACKEDESLVKIQQQVEAPAEQELQSTMTQLMSGLKALWHRVFSH
jgi:serine/threonine-protein kinase